MNTRLKVSLAHLLFFFARVSPSNCAFIYREFFRVAGAYLFTFFVRSPVLLMEGRL